MSFGLDPTNETYTKVQDTVLDSGIVAGLHKLGITLPTSFRAGKGYVDLQGASADSVKPVIDEETGQQVQVADGEQFVSLRVGTEGSLTGGSALSVTAGLAATSSGAIAEALTSVLGTVDTVGGSLSPAVHGGVAGPTNKYLVARIQRTLEYTGGKVVFSYITL